MSQYSHKDRIVWTLAYAMTGGFVGFFGGFAIAVLQAPANVPSQPLANEWYSLAIAVFAFYGMIAGAALGLTAALVGQKSSGWKLFLWGVLGVIMGSCASALFPHEPQEWIAGRSILVATGLRCRAHAHNQTCIPDLRTLAENVFENGGPR